MGYHKVTIKTPTPAKLESRNAFDIAYFRSEAEARIAHEIVRSQDMRHEGGHFDGMPCGRDSGRDRPNENGEMLYAVTYIAGVVEWQTRRTQNPLPARA